MLAVGLALLFCARAQAGTYEVWSCADAAGTPVVADGWVAEGAAQFSPSSNACASGGGLYAWLNGAFDHPVGTSVAWHFTAPPDTKIARYRVWRAAVADADRPNETPLYTM